MKMSQLFTKTTKNVPADEVSKNARLLIQAGYIHKEMAGVYSYLPLGLRVLNNIARIVREEMDAIGGQEVSMPALQVKERYEATGRWDDEIVDIWFKTALANGAELGLGFSHEENLSPIVKKYVSSYKDLPLFAYQIQTKFRNELRSKSGLMRGREFLMKDMYSFALSQAQHDKLYELSKKAYTKVYKRVGIGDRTVMVLASGGSFSKYSHEFQTFSEAGEDSIFRTEDGTYYNREIAPSKVSRPNKHEAPAEYKEVLGKGVVGVQALLKHLGIPIEKSTKTLIYRTDTGEVIIAAVRSDYDVNELKLCEAAGCNRVSFASEQEVEQLTGASIGYAGLVNLPKGLRVFLDDSLHGLCNFETGANKTGYHAVNVNFGRDVPLPDTFYDIKVAKEGDLEPKTGKVMHTEKAIEVGNIFTLGTKFSAPFDLAVPDESGVQTTVLMGCYGIGVSRLMGTVAELLSDDKGLVWPDSIAPFKVYLARIGASDAVGKKCDELYEHLTRAGVAVLYDDRLEARAGEKFADADLLGIPYRLVVSDKTLASNKFELKKRTEQAAQLLDEEAVINLLAGKTTNLL
ncbi:MAG TPA: proline--tRNA ligase [Candidatus Saccharimonadales bacterium]|nr:proline--tRNA ligase [Candidatus Saccharimonadales bacterium]